jgi:hypothetical protein
MITGGFPRGTYPNVYRTHAASTDLKTVSGAPKRCACFLSFQNSDEATEAIAVFQGPDGTDVTITVPPAGSVQVSGDFSTTGAFGATITCLAGWIDDGSVQSNG